MVLKGSQFLREQSNKIESGSLLFFESIGAHKSWNSCDFLRFSDAGGAVAAALWSGELVSFAAGAVAAGAATVAAKSKQNYCKAKLKQKLKQH